MTTQSSTTQASTKNDGITPDKYLSYIQLNGSSGLSVPLDDYKFNQKISYTLMLWMKPQDTNFGKNYQYAVSFDDSLECYFSGTDYLMCDSDSKGNRLKVSTDKILTNQWTHFTVGGSVGQSSYLQLEKNGNEIIENTSTSYLNLQQKYQPWRVCLGGCSSDYVFIGGLREFKFFSTFINSTRASVLKNHYMLWDTQMLAYYRFAEADVLSSEITSKKAQITSDTYQLKRDYSVNDICYPITSYLSLYKFKTNNDFATINLDGRYNPSLNNWGYTLSMWLQLNSTSCYQSNPTIAKTNCYLLLVEDAFMIFSPAPNQIAAYFFNIKAYYQFQSKSIYVPYNQWFNLQFLTSQYQGYEFRVYDIIGRYMGNTTESRNLQEVKVTTKQLKVFSQFKGIVKSLVLYQTAKSLPLKFPNVDFKATDPNIIDNDCLAYFEFQEKFVFSSNPIKIKNLCRSYQYGMMHMSLANNIDDDYVGTYWKTYTSVSNDGLINSSPKFDGMACEDGDVVLEIQSAISTVSTSTVRAIPQSTNATVEFWFKSSVPVIQTNYLLSLWGRIRSKEYFSFFFDNVQNKKLVCAPFGFLSTSLPVAAFEGYTDNNRQASGWFHIACQYEQQKEIVGYLYNGNGVDERVVTSLTSSNLVIQPDTYDLYVGNDPTLGKSTVGTRFKEVRFWGIKRTQSEIKYWRFRQIDPTLFTQEQFLIYLRLNEGQFQEYNAASIINQALKYPVVAFQEVGYASDSDLVICPASTFLSSDNNCYLDPVQSIDGAIYPVFDSTNSTLSWLFSASESVMMDSSVINQIRVAWSFDDVNTQAVTQKNAWYKQGTDLKVPSSVFRDGSQYSVRLNFSNSDLTYQDYKDFNFIPRSCQYYIVSGSNSYQNYVNYTQSQSKYDITFNLSPVSLKTYCNEVSFYNQLLENIDYKFSPPLTVEPQLKIVINTDQTISVTIPAKEQLKFPLQQNVSIIFNLQYANSYYLQQGASSLSDSTFQNVKTTYYFNLIGQTLTTNLQANSSSIYRGQGVQLQAATLISNSDANDYKRMSYNWVCSALFRSICPTTNVTSFTISNEQFVTLKGVYDSLYTFQINVTYINVQGEIQNDLKSIQLRWFDLVSPDFKIASPTPVLATADNQSFLITFDSYPTLAEIPNTITVVWSIVPNISSSNYMITNSSTNLTVRANGFSTGVSYIVSATAYNQNGTTTISRYHFLSFTTQNPPSGGTVTINPFIGYVGETNLTVSILNWQSNNKPIRYRLWSTTNAGGNTPNKLISLDWISEAQTFRFIPTDTFPYLIQIIDNSGESVYVKNTPGVTVRINNNAAMTNLIQQQQKLQIILDTESIQDKYDSLTKFASDELNTTSQDNSDQSTTAQNTDSSTEILAKTQTKLVIVDTLQTDTQQILDQLKSESDNSIVSKGALKVLSVILQDTNSLSTELVLKTVNVIKNILQQDETIVQSLLRDQVFQNNFANSISSLIYFENSSKSSGRLLQQDQTSNLTEQTRQLKAILEDQLCTDSLENQAQQQIVTPAFNLLVQKFTFDTSLSSQAFRYVDDSVSGVTFNIQQISQSLKQSSASILDTFCVISTFTKSNNNLYNTETQQQYSPQIAEYDIQNARTKQSYQPSLYTPQDNVVVEFSVNPSTFKNNQTICMAFQQSSSKWNGEACLTMVDSQRVSVKCQCTVSDSNEFTLINDYTRELAASIQFSDKVVDGETSPTIISDSSITTVENSNSFFMMAALLLVVMFALPAVSIILDKRDIRTSSEKQIEKPVLRVLDQLSKLTDKPLKYWMMRNIQVQETMIDSKSLFAQSLQEIHPIINLLQKFSVEQPRIHRFATLLLQISLFTLILTVAFNPSYRQTDSSRIEDGLDQYDIRQSVLLGFLGMIILLPASLLTNQFNRTVKSEGLQEESNKHTEQSRYQKYQSEFKLTNEAQVVQPSPSKILYTNQRILQNNISQTQEIQRPSLLILGQNQQKDLEIKLSCAPLLYITLATGYIIAITTLALCFIYANQMPVSNQYCLVLAFYIGVIGSILFSNMLRVLLNTLLLNKHSKSEGLNRYLISLVLSREAIEMYKTNKMIQEAQSKKEKISKNGTQQQLLRQSTAAGQTGNTTQKNMNGGTYNLSRGQSIDASKEFEKTHSDHEDDHDLQDNSIRIEHLHQIDDDALQSKELSPSGNFKQQNSIINIEELDYDLNSSIDARADSIESKNMKSITPMTQSVMNNNSGAKGLFNSLRRHNSNKNMNPSASQARSIRNSKTSSPDQRKISIVDLNKYAQIVQQNSSHNENLMAFNESNRVQLE